jgi:murein DD-endopeptidase MepM/ murein hydrolase activator NlpD
MMMLLVFGMLPFVFGVSGYYLAAMYGDEIVFNNEATEAWQQDLSKQKNQLEELRQQAGEQLDGLTTKIATLQARLVRLDALGERLVSSSRLSKGEFDFSQAPAVGGPIEDISVSYIVPDLASQISQLAGQIDSREQQLEVLGNLLDQKATDKNTFLAGRPIQKGWMSSRYGRRIDPFNGKIAWHKGVDFAGKDGSPIVSVASGVVTWADNRYGYGLMVEINHGNGYKTRYAPAKSTDVKVGDVVRKGQVLALMGSSGRSTGPHVHFEVYKNGRAVDPASYIHRTHR